MEWRLPVVVQRHHRVYAVLGQVAQMRVMVGMRRNGQQSVHNPGKIRRYRGMRHFYLFEYFCKNFFYFFQLIFGNKKLNKQQIVLLLFKSKCVKIKFKKKNKFW